MFNSLILRVHQSVVCLEDLETRPRCPRGCRRGRLLPLRRDHPDALHIGRLLDLQDLIGKSYNFNKDCRKDNEAHWLGNIFNQIYFLIIAQWYIY